MKTKIAMLVLLVVLVSVAALLAPSHIGHDDVNEVTVVIGYRYVITVDDYSGMVSLLVENRTLYYCPPSAHCAKY